MENLTPETLEFDQRPQFLKTLCILSFIMCGIMLLFALVGLKNIFMSPEEIMGMNPYLQTMQDENPTAYQALLDSMQYKNINAILSFVMPLLSLWGVILMWKMKKTGFYIYLVGELLPYITVAIFNGMSAMYASTAMMGDKGTIVMNVIIGMIIVFDILFIVLYALNLKHLK